MTDARPETPEVFTPAERQAILDAAYGTSRDVNEITYHQGQVHLLLVADPNDGEARGLAEMLAMMKGA